MKKDDIITYIVLWSVLLGICFYLIYTGGPFSIYAKESGASKPETEDAFLYEQIVAENEAQAQKKQEETDAGVLAEQQAQAQAQAQAEEEARTKNETSQVLSQAAEALSQSQDVVNGHFIVDPNTTLAESDVPVVDMLGKDMRVQTDAGQPQILIYHTHATEGFVDSDNADPSTTVVGVGNYLQELLTQRYGYQVLHVTDAYDLAEGELNRSRAYNYARDGIAAVMEQYPSIDVIIDLHRDGVDESKHLVTEVDGKPTAQIMFFNGLSKTKESGPLDTLPNPHIQDNLAFSLQLEVLANNYYPDFMRGIYVKGYRYNLHFRPKSLLLEVGAQNNTVEEAKNAMEPFSDILNKLLKGT